jgi:hypothetical protein
MMAPDGDRWVKNPRAALLRTLRARQPFEMNAAHEVIKDFKDEHWLQEMFRMYGYNDLDPDTGICSVKPGID